MLAVIALALAALLLGAALRQWLIYHRLRRERVVDRQPPFYPASTFHAVTFLKLPPGGDALETLRTLRGLIEGSGRGILVYAGLAGPAMAKSTQLPNDWDALAFAEYPSREAFDRLASSREYRGFMASQARSHTHGVRRPMLVNLLVPVGLLLLRLRDILLRKPPVMPFTPVGDDAQPGLRAVMEEIKTLDALRDIKDDAVVIFNLIEPGTAEQRRADREYTLAMMSAMAEGRYGPMHIGDAVRVEGDAHFSRFAAVYYPGIDHMHAMIGSTFMNRIGRGKQLGDSLAVATIPALSKL